MHTADRAASRALFRAASVIGSFAALWLAAAGCAEQAPGLDIAEGGEPPGIVTIPRSCDISPACGDYCACGNGCCPEGDVCVAGSRCWTPDQPCATSDDCADADTYCNTQAGQCLPYVGTGDSSLNTSCRVQADLPTLVPEVKCRWPGDTAPGEFPEHVQVAGTPMVIDFDFDGNPQTIEPSIVFVSYAAPYINGDGVLRVIDGRTCETQHTIKAPYPIPPDAAPALANLDLPDCPRNCPDTRGDYRPEIVIPAVDKSGPSPRPHILAYRYTGGQFVQWWDAETATAVEKLFSISVHDLDNDGAPEVLTADQVIEPNGIVPGEVQFTIPFLSGRGLIEPPIVTDITGDRFPDIVTGQGIYVWDLLNNQLERGDFWPSDRIIEAAFTAVAELDDKTFDPLPGDQPEMIIVEPTGAVTVLNVAGQLVQRSNAPNAAGGPPTVADFDGDGRMEYASAGKEFFTVFDLDCRTGENFNRDGCAGAREGNTNAILWQQRSLDTSSGTTGSSVFDFDADGKSEIVYADECFMRIYDGATGNVLQSVPRSSRTNFEYPVIADVDNDGHADIVVGSNDNNPGFNCPATDRLKPETRSEMTHGITVWSNDSWAGARTLWNQYAYYVVHVDDRGQIPASREVPRFWMAEEGDNSFRQNTQGLPGTSFSFDQSDLTTIAVPGYACLEDDTRARVNLQVCNRGLLPVPANQAEIQLRAMGDSGAAPMCSARVAGEIGPGRCETVLCTMPAPAQPLDVEVVVDPSGRVDECIESNNTAQVFRVACGSDVPR